ncbi:DUF1232 domain-containing protein [Sphingomicrobium sp. XHP0235]|uniref:YkvA family protein n=1 Tax=Sphingomicrobium aquimarinum TaxID=3133971 RepID=UPI0031FF0AFF
MTGSPSVIERWRGWAQRLKTDAVMLWLAARDPDVSWGAKAIAAMTAAYALSPIDLIPDFIPVLGLLDDLLIVPAGVWLAMRMIDPRTRARLRKEAVNLAQRPVSRTGAAVVIALWVVAAALLWRWAA